MEKKIIKTRKINGEIYKFILNSPSYKDEKGCLGVETTPYISVLCPENCLGYNDYIGFSKNHWNGEIYATSNYRNFTNTVLKQLCKTYCILAKKYNVTTSEIF